MTKENYEQLKKEIIKAVPEIMELKFECRVLLDDKKKHQSIVSIVTDTGIFYKLGIHYDGKKFETNLGLVGRDFRYEFYEVIGRPIKLEDVLIALSENNIVTELGIFIDIMGRFWKIEPCYGKNKMRIVSRWQLNKDLDWHWENKKETIEFLYNLIIKK